MIGGRRRGGSLEVLNGLQVEQSPCVEAISASYTREIRAVLWNSLVFHYRAHNSPTSVRVLSQNNSLPARQSRNFKVTLM